MPTRFKGRSAARRPEEWAEYVGEYRPVILVHASPKLRETFLSAMDRGMARGRYPVGADEIQDRLLSHEIALRRQGDSADSAGENRRRRERQQFGGKSDGRDLSGVLFLSLRRDFAKLREGYAAAFLREGPKAAVSKILDVKTIGRVAADFEPFRKGQAQSASATR